MYTNNKSTGVYALICCVNKRVYIGSAASYKGFQNRLAKHRYALRKGFHHSPILQKDYDRYGFDAFEFLVIEECETREQCERVEQFWLDWMGVGSENDSYNICTRVGIAPSPKGRKDKPETIAKRVASNRANPWSEEVKNRAKLLIAEANSKEYVVIAPDGTSYKIKNLATFCRQHELIPTNMLNVAQIKQDHHKGWKCRYASMTQAEFEAGLQALIESRKRVYICTSPENIEYRVEKLAQFCRSNSLCINSMSAVASGKCLTHRGWRCRRASEIEEEYLARAPRPKGERRAKRWIVTMPSGEEQEITNLSQFCRTHGLSAGWMVRVAKGNAKHCKNYRCRYAD